MEKYGFNDLTYANSVSISCQLHIEGNKLEMCYYPTSRSPNSDLLQILSLSHVHLFPELAESLRVRQMGTIFIKPITNGALDLIAAQFK